jgi:hypothetical protein
MYSIYSGEKYAAYQLGNLLGENTRNENLRFPGTMLYATGMS